MSISLTSKSARLKMRLKRRIIDFDLSGCIIRTLRLADLISSVEIMVDLILNKLEDSIYWYKANMHGDFRIGAPEFWQHSAHMKKDKDGDDSYDPNAARKLKGPQINIRKL